MSKELIPVGTKVAVRTDFSVEEFFDDVAMVFYGEAIDTEVSFIKEVFSGTSYGIVVDVEDDDSGQRHKVANADDIHVWVYDDLLTVVE